MILKVAIYRWHFNGKEVDNQLNGDYDYGFRMYDPRIGRFLSIDHLFKGFPELTPYQFSDNNPIKFVDLDGLESTNGNNNAKSTTSQENTKQPSELNVFEQALVNFILLFSASVEAYQNLGIIPQSDIDKDKLSPIDRVNLNLEEGIEAVTEVITLQAGAGVILSSVKLLKPGAKATVKISKATLSVLRGEKGILSISKNSTNRFSVAVDKFNFFFGKVTSSPDNTRRSKQIQEGLQKLGIEDNPTGEAKLLELFDKALDSPIVIDSKIKSNGQIVTKQVQVSEKGALNIGFFFEKGGDGTPKVVTIIPKLTPTKTPKKN